MIGGVPDDVLRRFSSLSGNSDWESVLQWMQKEAQECDVRCRSLEGASLFRVQGVALALDGLVSHARNCKAVLSKRK
jgi:hypothetical protein